LLEDQVIIEGLKIKNKIMSKRQWLCIMGVWVMIFLFLGFPIGWHKIILAISGLIIIAIAYNLPQESSKITTDSNSTFVESDNKNN
jgi:membrane-bound ClpP family serine protease